MINNSLLRGSLSVLVLTLTFLTYTTATAPAAHAAVQPGVRPPLPQTTLTGNYIVVLKDKDENGVSNINNLQRNINLQSVARKNGAKITNVYSSSLHGFAASHVTAAGLAALKADSTVETVVPDVRVRVDATDKGKTNVPKVIQQTNATWGPDRIDQRKLPLDKKYSYPSSAGKGVRVYTIDTGIRATHSEFKGRVAAGYDFFNKDNNPDDCSGHGTHVAGIIAGKTYGVAKAATIVPINAFDCGGYGKTSTIIQAIDWVTQTHKKRKDLAVVNMSLSIDPKSIDPNTGDPRGLVDKAVQNSIKSGVTYVVAAGNDAEDACTSTPSRMPQALVVGATTNSDELALFSNWGTCVDILAPGQDILSAGFKSDTASIEESGTSMASPHGAGAAALVLSAHPKYTPAQVNQAIISSSTPGLIDTSPTGLGGSNNPLRKTTPNKLLYVGTSKK